MSDMWRRLRSGLGDALLFLLLALVGLRYAGRLQASGDEPHYLLMAQSLWQERDLDLRDNYERQDFLDYTPGPLLPHYAAPRRDGRPYPAHSPGLPLMLAPVYAAGGRRACVIMMAGLAALLTREARRLARELARDETAARLAWLAAAGAPVFFYSFHIYTEVPCALALALSLRLLTAERTTPLQAAAAALCACALPWLHVKMVLAAVALGAIAMARLDAAARVAFWITAVLGAVSFVGYYQSVFGSPSPLAIYGGVPADVARSAPLQALVGLFLDRSFGLLPYAPVFVFALAGIPVLLRKPRAEFGPLAAVALGVLAPALFWRMWWGGQCPPARLLVPLVPLLAALLALGVGGRRRLLQAASVLLAVGWALGLFAVWRPEDRLLLNRGDRPTRLWEATFPAIGRLLPSLVPSTEPR